MLMPPPLLAPIAAARGIRALSYEQLLAFRGGGIAKNQQRAAGHDSLHQRHDEPAEGRRHNSCQHYGANRQPGGSLGVVGRRSHFAVFAAAPCARDHQCAVLCTVVGSNLRDAAALRCECSVGPHRRRQHHSVHGGADDLCKTHHGLGRGFAGAPRGPDTGMRPVALDGFRFGGVASEHAPTLEGNQLAILCSSATA